MIRVKFLYQNDCLLGFDMQGHAGAGEYGFDIVCSAVSVLSINTINSLEQLLHVKPHIISDEKNGGLLKVTLNENDILNPEVKLLMDSFKLGLTDIEKNYGEYIKIKDR